MASFMWSTVTPATLAHRAMEMDVHSRSANGAIKAVESSGRNEIVVFWIVRDSVCADCGEELGKGRFLRLEAERPLCLRCADLDHLMFLGRGDAALTRRASRYSTLRAGR